MQRASFTNYCETHASIFSHVSLKLQLRCCRTSQLQLQWQWQLQHLFCSSVLLLLLSLPSHCVRPLPRASSSLLSTLHELPVRLSVCLSVLLSCLLSACLAIFQLLTASSGLMSAVNDNNYNNNINNNNRISKNNNSSLLGTVCSCCARTCNLLGY